MNYKGNVLWNYKEKKITDNLPVIYNIIGRCLLEEDDIYKRVVRL